MGLVKLTKEQITELGLRLKKNGVQKICPLCKHEDLSIEEAVLSLLCEDGLAREFFTLICPRCKAMYLFPTFYYGLKHEEGIYPNSKDILK
jgi:hypothetical protein